MSAPEKVFPATPPPASSPVGGGNPLASLRAVDKKVWAGGGALVVVVLALTVGRSKDPESDPDATGAEGGAYELDTRETDLYNELQPELENIADAIRDAPKWPQPKPPQQGNPHGNNGGPRPGGGGPVRRTYRVKQGDTLAEIAKKFKVKGGRARLYRLNRTIIKRAAIEHKDPKPATTMKLYPGTILVIP